VSSISTTLLSTAGFALVLAGFVIQKRNRSPYSGTQMDQVAMKRFGVGMWLAALGSLCMVLSQLIKLWR